MAQHSKRSYSPIVALCVLTSLVFAPVVVLIPSAISHKYPVKLRLGNRSLFMGRYESASMDESGTGRDETVWNSFSKETCGGWRIRWGWWDYNINWAVKEPWPPGMAVLVN